MLNYTLVNLKPNLKFHQILNLANPQYEGRNFIIYSVRPYHISREVGGRTQDLKSSPLQVYFTLLAGKCFHSIKTQARYFPRRGHHFTIFAF